MVYFQESAADFEEIQEALILIKVWTTIIINCVIIV